MNGLTSVHQAGVPPPTGSASVGKTLAVPVAIAAGVLLGFAYTLSAMTAWFAVASVVLVWVAGRGLPPRERRWVQGLLISAILVRAAPVGRPARWRALRRKCMADIGLPSLV